MPAILILKGRVPQISAAKSTNSSEKEIALAGLAGIVLKGLLMVMTAWLLAEKPSRAARNVYQSGRIMMSGVQATVEPGRKLGSVTNYNAPIRLELKNPFASRNFG